MLLRVEDLSTITGLSMINAFMLGGQIVCVSKHLNHDWTMYKIDPDSFAVQRFAQIIVFGVDLSALNYIYRVTVHNNVAYAWSGEWSGMIAGTIEGDEFHWEEVKTVLPEILATDDCKYLFGEGTTSALTMIVSNSNFPFSIICQFDIPTKKWTQYEVIDDLVGGIKGKSRYVWTVNGKVHLFMYDTAECQIHMVMDMKTKEWKVAEELSNETNGSQCKYCIVDMHFIHLDKLYKICETDESKWSIYIFNDVSNTWTKKCDFEIDPQTARICNCTAQVVVSGNRFFLMTQTNQEEWYLSKVYVIDMDPCLLDRTLTMVRGDRNLMKLGEEVLPRDIRRMLRRDTTGDSLAIKEMAEYFASIIIPSDPIP